MPEPTPCPQCGHLFVWDGKRCVRKQCRFGSSKRPLKITLKARINGVHPIEMQQAVHLIDLTIHGDIDEFEIGDVTQELPGVERINWQAPYDEQVINETERSRRFVFFFHYLDFKKPLITSCGELQLPNATQLPKRLQSIKYEEP